jgi:hypothetical protein
MPLYKSLTFLILLLVSSSSILAFRYAFITQTYNDRELRLSSYAHHDIAETVHETAVIMNCCEGQYWLQRPATCDKGVNTGY